MKQASLDALQAQLENQLFQHQIQTLLGLGKAVFSTSLGVEDQIITHWIASESLAVEVFTLDTGRQFQETYDTLGETVDRYPLKIKTCFPEREAIEALVEAQGINGFYASVENRKACCGVRKVAPLKRALAGAAVWITGLRQEQSPTRQNLGLVEWDAAFQVLKFNPLLHWTTEAVWNYVRANKLPYNKLHDAGFPSIGCAPCTRAIAPNEDLRAGRWWWEQPAQKECGLHLVNGVLMRQKTS